jgi:hypothetical protein
MPLELNKRFENDLTKFAEHTKAINDFTDSDVEQVNFKENLYRESRSQRTWISDRFAANIWTGAFFYPLKDTSDKFVPTDEVLKAAIDKSFELPTTLTAKLESLTEKHKFFHWPLEFPEVFARGGFDVVLGNPPWEQIQPEEIKFFGVLAPDIAALAGAKRKTAIDNLPSDNPSLAIKWDQHQQEIAQLAKFVRSSQRFQLTAVGKLDTYPLFAELSRKILSTGGRSGVIVPTGIATDDSCKYFFGNLNDQKALVSLYDFENREKLFPEVDSRKQFSLLTTSRKPVNKARFSFFLTNTKHLDDRTRKFDLTPLDLELINPNTRTAPLFRTKYDAEITTKIYRRVPVLINERTGENPWGISFKQGLFNMTSGSHLFKTSPGPGLVPLYESKMIHQYDHRFGTYEGVTSTSNTSLPTPTPAQHADPNFFVQPRYWVSKAETDNRLGDYKHNWLMGFRDIARATDERTFICSVFPRVGVGHTLPVFFAGTRVSKLAHLLCVNFNSIASDFVTRQKTGGTHLTYFIVKQLPVFPPSAYEPQDVSFITPRVIELVYTSYDMAPFARDCGYDGPPFKWDEGRRALLRAELDAYYAHLYGLTRDELLYILDPEDVYGPDFPGETFRGLKNKDIRQYGEYRTKRLVLEAWDRLFK